MCYTNETTRFSFKHKHTTKVMKSIQRVTNITLRDTTGAFIFTNFSNKSDKIR